MIKLSDIPRMNSAKFTLGNSGRKTGFGPPWFINTTTAEMYHYSSGFKPIGYTMSPPFKAAWDRGKFIECVAIMYEDTEGDIYWWHHVLPEDFIMTKANVKSGSKIMAPSEGSLRALEPQKRQTTPTEARQRRLHEVTGVLPPSRNRETIKERRNKQEQRR